MHWFGKRHDMRRDLRARGSNPRGGSLALARLPTPVPLPRRTDRSLAGGLPAPAPLARRTHGSLACSSPPWRSRTYPKYIAYSLVRPRASRRRSPVPAISRYASEMPPVCSSALQAADDRVRCGGVPLLVARLRWQRHRDVDDVDRSVAPVGDHFDDRVGCGGVQLVVTRLRWQRHRDVDDVERSVARLDGHFGEVGTYLNRSRTDRTQARDVAVAIEVGRAIRCVRTASEARLEHA
jgi:hypothetical protein